MLLPTLVHDSQLLPISEPPAGHFFTADIANSERRNVFYICTLYTETNNKCAATHHFCLQNCVPTFSYIHTGVVAVSLHFSSQHYCLAFMTLNVRFIPCDITLFAWFCQISYLFIPVRLGQLNIVQ